MLFVFLLWFFPVFSFHFCSQFLELYNTAVDTFCWADKKIRIRMNFYIVVVIFWKKGVVVVVRISRRRAKKSFFLFVRKGQDRILLQLDARIYLICWCVSYVTLNFSCSYNLSVVSSQFDAHKSGIKWNDGFLIIAILQKSSPFFLCRFQI